MKKLVLITWALIVMPLSHAIDIKVQGTQDSYLTSKHEFNGFGCKGENLSPVLKISDLPKNTKSLAITLYDPDAPTGGGWWHWLAINIPVTKTELVLGDKSLKKLGILQTLNSYGSNSFGGPCPPKGDTPHRYIFTVYALKVKKLDLKESTTPNIVGYNLNANTIVKATSTLLYGRK
ncbi:YbhB/YbcL family Raf kinase inhibitor-like protein [Bacteriovoracaceae bacterium]|nr:YbhB/YbcL family Raf kinase inhibitor-like protein [Bacteriovoracaceae bacterium]